MKLVFFGSSRYCLPVVKSLADNFELKLIAAKDNKSPVANFARQNSLPFVYAQTRADLLSFGKKIREIAPILLVVADFGLIIPKEIFSLPDKGTVNIHFSRLPELRGASPVQYTILAGENKAWITFQQMAEGLDSGSVIFLEHLPLSGDERTDELYTRLFTRTAALAPQVLKDYLSGKIKTRPQDHSLATFTKILNRKDGFIPWDIFIFASLGQSAPPEKEKTAFNFALRRSASLAEAVERTVRALHPWPGVWTEIDLNGRKRRLKIIEGVHAGGKFVPRKVQLEGKKPVTWKQFLEGYGDSLPSTSSMAWKSSLK
ncbi:MAG: methionyl-tRNA formyltransferase, methionyl-tRNA formyltransferase [Candidatus Gottesmanbacteria bacterium GW2011_GWA2_43_14]|uniref:methionyl-tRNA formyltransferase n=1 Tax=Candidatus Gottesmanbacteria bacterium GW2011_GWA2_43_14 TaxID=1618443 RepID=A0A0G1G8W3_9BACT|nr:MAG: methionyl-tRNA formyltransferase, methionyl-tRNA formyltransferase [Candidatus Gottesmanbacteria bacterium GW2011_GWA2_43_14]